MQPDNNANQQNQAATSKNRKILIIICIYFFVTTTSKYTQKDEHTGLIIRQKIVNRTNTLELADIADVFDFQQPYEGRWRKMHGMNGSVLQEEGGRVQLRFSKISTSRIEDSVKMEMNFMDGEYIDQGTLRYTFALSGLDFISEKAERNQYKLKFNETEQVGTFNHEKIMQSVDMGMVHASEIVFSFTLKSGNVLDTTLEIVTENSAFLITSIHQSRNLFQTLLFAFVLFVISFVPFVGLAKIITGIHSGEDNVNNYSLATVCLTAMWDTVICMVTFIFAFDDQYSIVLFIMPAMILCLMFTSFEPRFMLIIYQSLENSGHLCSFNFLHYGSLMLIYPLLMFTNFNWLLFVLMSCILLPQIYSNGVNGVRPNLRSSFYTKYIFGRYLILLYLRSYPYNIFGFEPNYPLCLGCFLLVSLQYGILCLQNIYGPKKVLPSCLFPPVYDYKFEEINVEEDVQVAECAICLNSLTIDPPTNRSETDLNANFKLMRTPCKHKYHTSCLLLWMKIKLQCPQCRAKLPPYQ